MMIPDLLSRRDCKSHDHDEKITRSSGAESSAESIPSDESIASTAKR
jgi:hypothetical protein